MSSSTPIVSSDGSCQYSVNVSAMDSFHLSAAMPLGAAEVMEEKEEVTKLKPDGDPSIKLNPNAVSPRQLVDYAASEQLLQLCFISVFLLIIIFFPLRALTHPPSLLKFSISSFLLSP
ncbi:unnamed protein product [Dibothriocephalus latus]|uniref:Uncharacterized protein n=1 Tax=Dibothriocephalus latus TaxID=60516 RepID=A0A3P7NAW0_DIBLA|nr:unnamed protein product [Dibothriocephalus latus]